MSMVASWVAGEIVDKVIDLLLETVRSRIDNFKEHNEIKKHLKQLKNWYHDYSRKHDMTVVDSQAFEDYLINFHVMSHFLDYIIQPSEPENLFLKSYYESANEYLGERYSRDGRNITIDDQHCVREVIEHIFYSMLDYFRGKIEVNDIGLYYTANQTNKKIDSMSNDVHAILDVFQPPKISIEKKIYPMPQNTILRCAAPYKYLQDGFSLFDYSEDLIEICQREKHVVLLGEAGCGKSIAIRQLAATVDTTVYYPILYNLNNYVDASIQQIIQDEYPNVNANKIFLILDAFDEIEDCHRKSFARRLNEFSLKNNDTIIVITSRNNFYRFSEDSESGLFSSFKEYGIVPLRQKDIENYAEDNGVSPSNFLTEISNKDLRDIAVVPFYLSELVKIYKRDNGLPEKSNIMQEIIRNRFDKDCNKYVTTKDIADSEYQIFLNLEKLAFGIQCLGTINLSNIDYQKLFDNQSRDTIRYSGIFSRNEKSEWSFEHNIFREYLAAKYIDKLPFDNIKALIFNKQGKIITSWINVLSFLVLIRNSSDLIDLLITEDPEILIRFEKNRIDGDTRTKLVIKILDGFAERNVWISRGLNSAERIAEFGQSKKLCKYLLDQIASPCNFRALSNAMSVLSAFTSLYDMDDQVQQVLLDCLKASNDRYYEKSKALDTIISLKLYSNDITSYLVNNFQCGADKDYNLYVLRYLRSINAHEKYIDCFISEFVISNRNFGERNSIRFEIEDAFCEVRDAVCLSKIIESIYKERRIYSIKLNRYEKIISNAVTSYKQGNADLLNTVIEAFSESQFYHRDLAKLFLAFFEETETKTLAFMRIAKKYVRKEEARVITLLEALGDEECYKLLLAEYKGEPEKYEGILKWLVCRFDTLTPLYKDYATALSERGVTLPERKPYFDYEKAREEGRQICFNALFDKTEYCKLIEKMVAKIGNEKITFSGLNKANCDFIDYHNMNDYVENFVFQQLYYDLLFDDENDDRIVLDTISSIGNWSQFIVDQTYHILRMNDKINISDDQKEFFEKYCKELLADIDFSKDFSDNDNGSITSTHAAFYFIFFSEFFDFVYDKDVYLKMLLIPPCFFEKDRKNGYSKIPQYICNHLSYHEIVKQIKHNLSMDGLCVDTVGMYIQFCKDNKLDLALNVAEKMCFDINTSSWHKSGAIQYVKEMKGYEYIYDRFMETDDKELMDDIIRITINYRDDRLRDRLEQINKESSDNQVYLGELIYLNSEYGLRLFFDKIRAAMNVTHFSYSPHYSSPLESMSFINDLRLLDTMNDIRTLLFTPEFEDRDSFGLYGSLYKAYVNLASYYFVEIMNCMQKAVQSDQISDEERSFCNTVLIDIERSNNQKSVIEWTILKIKNYWNMVDEATII